MKRVIRDTTPIAYVYDGLTHCVYCAEYDYGEGFIPAKTRDSRGEPVGVIEAWEVSYLGAIFCETNSCGLKVA